MSRLDTETRRLLDLRIKNEKAQKAAAKTKEKLDLQQELLWNMLEDQQLTTATLDIDGNKVQIGKRETIRSRVFNLEDALKWMEENGRLEEMSRPDVRKAPMNELVRECLENGTPLPRGVDYSSTKFIQVTRRST